MHRRRRVMAGGMVLICGLAVAGCSGGKRMVGRTAPDFSLKDMSGKEVSLSSFKGRPVLLSFWGAG